MKILAQVISVQPHALIVSLPNQIFGHIPITQISDQLNAVLDSTAEADSDDSEVDVGDLDQSSSSRMPELSDMFKVGQYVRTVVQSVYAAGSKDNSILGHSREDHVRASRRVELSIMPTKLNAGVQKVDLSTGFTLTASVSSLEDHGYLLDLGIPETTGFLSFEEAKIGAFASETTPLRTGQVFDVCIANVSSNGRTYTVSVDPLLITTSSVR